MELFNDDDETLIQKFLGLNTEDQGPRVVVPSAATSSVSWDLCLLAKVITDKTVLDMPFSSNMIRAWGSNPNTSVKPICKNCYLVEFDNEEDVKRALLGGPWTYRGDLVAMARVNSHSELFAEHVSFVELWVQFFNLPINTLTDEGLELMAGAVGLPVSLPLEGFVNGKRFVKMKVLESQSMILLRTGYLLHILN